MIFSRFKLCLFLLNFSLSYSSTSFEKTQHLETNYLITEEYLVANILLTGGRALTNLAASISESFELLDTPNIGTTGNWRSLVSDVSGAHLAVIGGNDALSYVYLTSNYGQTWTQSGISQGYWTEIAGDSTGEKLLVGEWDGYLRRSIDRGVTWTTLSTPAGLNKYYSVSSSADGTKLMAGMFAGGMYYSLNSGSSWAIAASAPSTVSTYWFSVASSGSGQYVVALQANVGMFYSSDYGATFTQSNSPAADWNKVACDVTGQYCAAVVLDGVPGYGILTSSTYGQTWVDTNNAPKNVIWADVASDATGMYLYAVVRNNGGVYMSVDRGVSWTAMDVPNSVWSSVICDSTGQFVTLANTTRIFSNVYMPDPTASPTTQPTVFPSVVPSIVPTAAPSAIPSVSPTISETFALLDTPNIGTGGNWRSLVSDVSGAYLAVIGGNDAISYVYLSANYGQTWTQSGISQGYWTEIAADSTGETLLVGEWDGYLRRSIDRGVTWTTLSTPAGLNKYYSVSSSADGTKLMAGMFAGGMYYSLDSGSSWAIAASAPSTVSTYWFSVASSGSGQYVVALQANVGMFYSSDYGATFTQSNSPAADWNKVACDVTGQYCAAVVLDGVPGYGIMTSSTYGQTWVDTNDAPKNVIWADVASDATGMNLYAGVRNNGGVYMSIDRGVSWSAMDVPNSVWSSVICDSTGQFVTIANTTRIFSNVYMPDPTASPSAVPTVSPSAIPSFIPSVLPSWTPSVAPSLIPSEAPSVTPTLLPSETPVVQPSVAPSLIPTTAPSLLPVEMPSVMPSINMSSSMPTEFPTWSPTSETATQSVNNFWVSSGGIGVIAGVAAAIVALLAVIIAYFYCMQSSSSSVPTVKEVVDAKDLRVGGHDINAEEGYRVGGVELGELNHKVDGYDMEANRYNRVANAEIVKIAEL